MKNELKISKEKHDEPVVQGKNPDSGPLLKFETPGELCIIISELVNPSASPVLKGMFESSLGPLRSRQGESYCDDNFPEMVKHAAEVHWNHVQSLRKQEL